MTERRFATTEKVEALIAAIKLNGLLNPDGSVEFNQQQALQLVLELRTDDPVAPVDGQIWLRIDL